MANARDGLRGDRDLLNRGEGKGFPSLQWPLSLRLQSRVIEEEDSHRESSLSFFFSRLHCFLAGQMDRAQLYVRPLGPGNYNRCIFAF